MLQRNLLYTGVTRGKQLVVLVGQKKAIAIAVRRSAASGFEPLRKAARPLAPRYPLTQRLDFPNQSRRGYCQTLVLEFLRAVIL